MFGFKDQVTVCSNTVSLTLIESAEMAPCSQAIRISCRANGKFKQYSFILAMLQINSKKCKCEKITTTRKLNFKLICYYVVFEFT